MRAILTTAVFGATLAAALPALALTPVTTPSPDSLAAARHFAGEPHLMDSDGALQSAMVGRGLRTDGQSEFSGEGSTSVGYLTSAEPAGPAKAQRYFEDELAVVRTPGVTRLLKPASAPQK